MSLEIGQIAGEYQVVQELGGGGHGRVYKVEHTITRRVEAIKVLADGIPVSEEQRRRFLREIQVQAQLCHPNIAAVHHAFWLDDDLVMVMEFVEGRSLRSLLAEGGVEPRVGIGYVSQVLDALLHAHSQGVVHRDVSPGNIIVGRAGLVKLTDFGLAKRVADTSITATGELLGSLPYMSPEQVRGVDEPDGRSDIYSCGVVLYEVATGRRPFESDCAFTLMRAHVELDPQPPSTVDARVTASLSDVILKAMAKDPADRFQNAAEFRIALEAADSMAYTAPVRRRTPLARFSIQPLISLARSQTAGIALGALFVTAVLGAVLWTGGDPGDIPAPVPVVVQQAPPAPPPAVPVEPPAPAPEPSQVARPSEIAQDTPRISPSVRTGARRKPFRPAKSVQPRPEVALLEPPPLPVEMPDSNRSCANVDVPEPGFLDPPKVQPAALPPPPSTGAGRVLRFLGKARVLNPFRLKAPKPADENPEK